MLYAIVAVLILILDQGLKYWTTLHLPVDTGLKELVPGFLQLRNVHNTGSAFSFLNSWSGARWLFLAVTVVFAILVILALRNRWIKGGFGRWMALFVLAGALGNGIDRCLYGYVVDMIEFAFKLPLIGSFPVFNVADVFITCGAIAFCLYILLHKERGAAAGSYAHVRSGPGGSVTTRPAPKPKAKPEPKPEPEKAEKAAARQTGRRETSRGGRHAEARESFTSETKRRPGEDPFAEWMGSAEIRTDDEPKTAPAVSPAPAREVAAQAPSAGVSRPVTLDIPETAGRDNPFKPQSGPVTLDIPETAGRVNPVKAQTGPVTLDIPAAAARTETKKPSAPVTLDIPGQSARAETPKPAPKPVTLDIPAPDAAPKAAPAKPQAVPVEHAAPKPAAPAPKTIELDDAADEEFTLEDILNEFRDL